MLNMDAMQLKEVYKTFLQEMCEIGWIQNYWWEVAFSLEELRVRMGSTSCVGYTRSHKSCAPHCWGGIVVEVALGAQIGVDLELYVHRSSFNKNRDVLLRRMQLPAETSPREFLEEWSIREAAYKALSQYGEREHPQLNWRKIRRINNSEVEFIVDGVRVSLLETRYCWAGDWLLSFARVV